MSLANRDRIKKQDSKCSGGKRAGRGELVEEAEKGRGASGKEIRAMKEKER